MNTRPTFYPAAAAVLAGERYDLLLTADTPGKCLFRGHIGHHRTNNGEGPGGLLTVVAVAWGGEV